MINEKSWQKRKVAWRKDVSILIWNTNNIFWSGSDILLKERIKYSIMKEVEEEVVPLWADEEPQVLKFQKDSN